MIAVPWSFELILRLPPNAAIPKVLSPHVFHARLLIHFPAPRSDRPAPHVRAVPYSSAILRNGHGVLRKGKLLLFSVPYVRGACAYFVVQENKLAQAGSGMGVFEPDPVRALLGRNHNLVFAGKLPDSPIE
jgi:hypothetical protein